jgi:hypothetical protein
MCHSMYGVEKVGVGYVGVRDRDVLKSLLLSLLHSRECKVTHGALVSVVVFFLTGSEVPSLISAPI